MINKIVKSEEEWKKILTPEQYDVMRLKKTEKPFSCELKNYHKDGVYCCAACDLPLFRSDNKFESKSGWPSFSIVVDSSHLTYRRDPSLGMNRIEVLCSRCDSHLGHVFDDGPLPTGKRFCINGIALKFIAD